MKLSLTFVLLSCLLIVTTACSEKPAGDTSATASHAPAGVKPGSHEDWCGEHAVPESQCTQCHEDLIPAFKATGDWCDEHGVPKSHCRKCDPSLVIQRPPKDATP